MEQFDYLIKNMAKAERIQVPLGFDNRNDELIKRLIIKTHVQKKFIPFQKMIYRTAFSCILIIFMTCVLTVAFFGLPDNMLLNRYAHKSPELSDVNNSVDQNQGTLDGVSSSNVKTVIDDENIRIDVLSVSVYGDASDVTLKVMVKNQENLAEDENSDKPVSYRFFNKNGSFFDNSEVVLDDYQYSDEDKNLEENQFKLTFSVNNSVAYDNKEYTICLEKLGYLLPDGTFRVLFDSNWQVNLTFNDDITYYKEINIDQPFALTDASGTLSTIRITALTCDIRITMEKDVFFEANQMLIDDMSGLKIKMRDNSLLSSDSFRYTCVREAEGFAIYLNFYKPIDADDIKSITLFDQEYTIE